MAVKEGLIGISSTNTSPLVSPTRSATTIFGTNPISVAAPGARGDDRFILDMSTSAVAIGKVEIQLRKNELEFIFICKCASIVEYVSRIAVL